MRGVGGGAAWPTSILFFFGGGGVLLKVHIRMRAHAHVCTHVLNIRTPMHACARMHAYMLSLCKHKFYILI